MAEACGRDLDAEAWAALLDALDRARDPDGHGRALASIEETRKRAAAALARHALPAGAAADRDADLRVLLRRTAQDLALSASGDPVSRMALAQVRAALALLK